MFFKIGARKTLLKKRLQHSCIPVKLAKFLRIPFLKENLRWLLLYILYARRRHMQFE